MTEKKTWKTRACRGCGKPIVWGSTARGQKIPLDLRPPVYAVLEERDGEIIVARDRAAMVSHFTTCPEASRFSRSHRPQPREKKREERRT